MLDRLERVIPSQRWVGAALIAAWGALAGCGGSDKPASVDGGASPMGGNAGTPITGTPVAVDLSATQQQRVQELRAVVAASASITSDELLAKHAPGFSPAVGYDPTKALGFDKVQASSFKLGDDELARLARDGFVVTDKHRFPHFAYGYKAIYADDLPVYVSADSILRAVHQSYDVILQQLEASGLLPETTQLVASLRARLPTLADATADVKRDVDLFLAVAASLLGDSVAAPVAGARAADVERLTKAAQMATGFEETTLFGTDRKIDWSQFKPRGHYTDTTELQRYFRAMMWLGRIDLPMLRTVELGKPPVLARRSVEIAFALRALMDEAAVARWNRIDGVVRAFVGEPDSMSPPQVDGLRTALGVSGWSIANVSDDALARAIVDGAYGEQKILSQFVTLPRHEGTWPLDATFLFFGQRYVIDSHVFSSVVYDRVNVPNKPYRMLPDPLDVAYAAFGNDQAAALLATDLADHGYAPALEGMRALTDAHPATFWDANLYNRWLSSLRALSPTADVATPSSGLPAVARTAAWGKRLLSTQLASWAELRRDTILYAKQSYTSGVSCEFPDAYVEPYPAFFAALEGFANRGVAISETLGTTTTVVRDYFAQLGTVAGTLRGMAERQRTGMPHDPAAVAFINQAVDVEPAGCSADQTRITGWYSKLYFSAFSATAFKPAIADVHTQPTDEGGNPVGRVLHVGTGWPRAMIVTVDTCEGPRAYVGLASSFHQTTTGNFERLDDDAWAARFKNGAAPEDPPWLRDLIVR